MTARTLLALAVLATPLAAQSPRDIVARGLDAMGGEAAARAAATWQVDYYLMTFGFGQSETPASPPRASITTGRAVLDWQGMRRQYSQETRGVTGAVTAQRVVALPERGTVGGAGPQWNAMGFAGVAGHQRFLRTQPHRLLLGALDAGAALRAAPAREFRGLMHDGVRLAGTDTVTMYFDRGTGAITVVEVAADDPILGDRVTTTYITRWAPAGELRVPRQYDVFVNGQLQQHVIYTAVTPVTGADSVFALPDTVRAAVPLPGPPPIVVRLVELGPGVWRAEGTSHHTLVVEQPDQIVLVEAPLSTQRVRAVLDTVRGRFPGKRIGVAVMTHHHWDHSGGIREIVAENIPVATHEVNAAFVRQVAAARRTIAPDLQAQRRRSPTLRTFTDSMVIGSGDTRVVLYAHPTMHAEGLLSAWVPSAGVLFTSDVLNPAATLSPSGSAELTALARARGIAPRSYAGGHGAVTPWADVERAAGR